MIFSERVTKVCLVCGIQYVGPLKALLTLHHDIPVHSDTNSTSLESIQLVANTTEDYSLTCLHVTIPVYRQVLIYTAA